MNTVEQTREAFNAWMCATRSAALRLCRPGGLYDGIEGCRRFARECAPALLDFGEYGRNSIGATYGAICVISYQLKPPVDAAQWICWMREKLEELERHKNER